jgi:hypothetical protein
MAVMMIQEFAVAEDDLGTANYDAVNERLNIGQDPPRGLIVHTAGFTGKGVFRIADVWESLADWESFRDGPLAEALKPMMESADASPPTEQYTYELHDVIKP